MKFVSLLPWFNKEIPVLRSLLIYGNHEGLLSFRQKYLKNLYQQQGHTVIYATSAENALVHYHSLPGLFESSDDQKCIILENVTDSFLTKIESLESLYTSRHFLILLSSKLSSRSKLVSAFQSNSQTGIVPCYEVNREEISYACQKLLKDRQCQLSRDSLGYLTNFLINETEKFFSIVDMIILYAGQEKLEVEKLKEILFSLQSSSLHKFNQYFLQEEIKSLQNLIKAIEKTEWVGIVRLLIQDIRTLLAFHIYRLKNSDLKKSWSKGPVKFPYPCLSLYEKVYSKWSLERCHLTLNYLVKLEKDLKSTSSPLVCEISNLLSLLSSHRNIIQ